MVSEVAAKLISTFPLALLISHEDTLLNRFSLLKRDASGRLRQTTASPFKKKIILFSKYLRRISTTSTFFWRYYFLSSSRSSLSFRFKLLIGEMLLFFCEFNRFEIINYV